MGIKESKINSQEVLFAFCAWLTTRESETIMGAKHDTSPVVERIKEFSDTNKLPDVRNNFTDYFKMPKGDRVALASDSSQVFESALSTLEEKL